MPRASARWVTAEAFGVDIMVENIEDDPDNTTRFFVIGGNSPPATGQDKTSIMVAVKDKVGALYDMLYPFKRHGINLSWIESRPSRRKSWDYYFFLDFNGHWQDDPSKTGEKALSAMPGS